MAHYITDANGNVIAIRISKDGEPEQWLHIYENNNKIGIYGVFVYNYS